MLAGHRYPRQGRAEEYASLVARLKKRLKKERREYLASFSGRVKAIVKPIG